MKTIPLFRLRPLALGAWLLAAIAAGAQPDQPSAPLPPVNADPAEAAFAPRLRQRGFTDEQTRQAFSCLADARRQGIPITALTLRLEEGLAKNVAPQNLLAALQTRLRFMLQAQTMVQAANYDMAPDSPGDELLVATGFATESGMSADDLAAVLRRGNGQSARRIQSIIEAGETLHLAGVDPATTRTLMNDCLDRDLRRMEVLRAVRYTVQQHRGGMDGDNIRRSLWGGKAAIEGTQGWHGGGAVNGNGAAGGSGRGYGAGESSRATPAPGAGGAPAAAPMATGNGSENGGSGSGGSGSTGGNGNGAGGPP